MFFLKWAQIMVQRAESGISIVRYLSPKEMHGDLVCKAAGAGQMGLADGFIPMFLEYFAKIMSFFFRNIGKSATLVRFFKRRGKKN
jgi:hypothetical protein